MGSGASKEELRTRDVVVIGAGYGGIQAALSLKKAGIPFKIIDPKEYFHHCVGALRASVFPEYANKVAIPLKEAFGTSFVQGKAISLDTENKSLKLEDGQELKYTHCIIAVGSLGPIPCRSTQTSISGLTEEYKNISEEISKARSIIIVGAGAVGVEMAGEIREKYSETKITIVSSQETLVADFTPKFQKNIKSILEDQNIQVVVGRVDLSSVVLNKVKTQNVQLSSGENISADLVISCIGLPSNVDSIKMLVNSADYIDNNRIKVNQYLQVDGLTNVFALGDCCNTVERKMAVYAGKQAECVVANIVAEAAGKQMTVWSFGFNGMLVPIGSKTGVGYINGFHPLGFMVRQLKSEDLFTKRYWGDLGVKMPA